MKKILAIFVLSVSLLVAGIVLVDIKKTVNQSNVSKKEKESKFKEVNDPIILKDNFQSGLEKWKIAINDPENRMKLDTDTISQRARVVDAPDMTEAYKGSTVRCSTFSRPIPFRNCTAIRRRISRTLVFSTDVYPARLGV